MPSDISGSSVTPLETAFVDVDSSATTSTVQNKSEGDAAKSKSLPVMRLNPYKWTLGAAIAFLFIYVTLGTWTSSASSSSSSTPSSLSSSAAGADNLVSMKELLSACIDAAKRGGVEVKKVREMADIGQQSKGETLEGANNPVTNGDMRSHRAIYHGLRSAFPTVNIISEEHESNDQENADQDTSPLNKSEEEVDKLIADDQMIPSSDIDVWIDPLDATQEYTERLLHFVTTMVCVAVKGVPVMGVIHKPFGEQTAWGWAGSKNIVNTEVLRDSTVAKAKAGREAEETRIIVSRSHSGKVDEVAKKAFGDHVQVTPAGGAGYKSWEVIKGEQDAYVHVTLIKKWDICAGNAILAALGGQLTTLKGEAVNYSGKPEPEPKNTGGVLATMNDRHQQYLNVLSEAVE